ncbi:hypothetical protein ZWY2020_052320 [Hordeum vulgare]|nr:hypothetical protein ZWY2020_052320 [Hordeum vulgare]
MPLAIAVPSAAAPLRRPHHFRFLQPSRKLSLSRTRCASSLPAETQPAPPQPRRYPRQYPGEAVGVAEEIRFVAMRLRNTKRSTRKGNNRADGVEEDDESEEEVEDNEEMDEEGNDEVKEEEGEDNHEVEEWMPSMEGFVRYLVDSKLVFDTVERIIAGSTDVAYVYFRRSAYLSELAGRSAPAFLSHYYNIYFSHTTGGLAIGKKTCDKILEGRLLEFYKWDSDPEILLKDAREKLNELSKHWSRKDRNLCLKEAAKCFQYMGRIVRLMVS